MTDEKTPPDDSNSPEPATDDQGKSPGADEQEAPPVPLSRPMPGRQTGRRPLFRG